MSWINRESIWEMRMSQKKIKRESGGNSKNVDGNHSESDCKTKMVSNFPCAHPKWTKHTHLILIIIPSTSIGTFILKACWFFLTQVDWTVHPKEEWIRSRKKHTCNVHSQFYFVSEINEISILSRENKQ